MSTLSVHDGHKTYGRVTALSGVSLSVDSGSFTAVLGPSGCGKTTLLRCVAGLERLDRGTITVDGVVLAGPGSHVPPHRRRIAIVPQEGALFPHRSVAGNVGFGLTGRGADARVAQVLELVGLGGLGRRMPHQLSGGQQQRVAVARALAPRPSIVVLDEPFSALDAQLRAEVRRDVRAALHEDGATAILVTHDQDEALSLADRVAVLREGQVVAHDTPAGLYAAPTDPWVGAFVGDAVLLPGEPSAEGARTALGEVALRQSVAGATTLTVLIRPEQIEVGAPAPGTVPATVVARAFHGHDAVLTLRLTDGSIVTARILGSGGAAAVGDPAGLRVVGAACAWPAQRQH